MKNAHRITLQIATDVVDDIIKLTDGPRPTRYERASAIRAVCDLTTLLRGRSGALTVWPIHATQDTLSVGFVFSMKFVHGTRSDLDAFGRIAERGGVIRRWAQYPEHSHIQARAALSNIIIGAEEGALRSVSEVDLARLIGTLSSNGAGRDSLNTMVSTWPWPSGVPLQERWACMTAFLELMAAEAWSVAPFGPQVQFYDKGANTVYFPLRSGAVREVVCSPEAFRRLVLAACAEGWLTLCTLGLNEMAVVLNPSLFLAVCAAVRQSKTAGRILAAHLDLETVRKGGRTRALLPAHVNPVEFAKTPDNCPTP